MENLDLNNYIENEKSMSRFSKELNFTGTRCSINLSFKEHHEYLPDNYYNAKIR